MSPPRIPVSIDPAVGRWLPAVALFAALALLAVVYLQRASFALDDYRYLWQVDRIARGVPGALAEALVVENRWDDVWWIPTGTSIRFFRPLVTPSYLLDWWIWGKRPVGFVLTNLLLHACVTFGVWRLLVRILAGGWGPLVGALAFASSASHAEVLHYVAGRTDSLALLPLLGALLAHLRLRGRRPALDALAVGVLGLAALLAKEWAALLPVLILGLDGLGVAATGRGGDAERRANVSERIRSGAPGLIASLVALGLYLSLRTWALGPAGAGSPPPPYFFAPLEAGFAAHALAVTLQYASALVCGTWVAPFLVGTEQLLQRAGGREVGVGLAALLALLVWGARQRDGVWLALLVPLAIVPLLPLYASGRYLLLASVGYCGLLGLVAREVGARLRGVQRLPLLLLVGAAVLVPAARHGEALDRMQPPAETPGLIMAPQLAGLFDPEALGLEPQRPVYIVDFPGRWIELQFLSDVLAVELGRALPPIRVLTPAPLPSGPPTRVLRASGGALELHRYGRELVLQPEGFALQTRPLRAGERTERPGFSLRVLQILERRPARVRVEFDRPIQELQLLRGRLDPSGRWRLEPVELGG